MTLCSPQCPKMPNGSSFCHCSSCHKTFTSESAFDKHWKGKGDERHCVSPNEAGLVEYQKSIGTVYGWPQRNSDELARLSSN